MRHIAILEAASPKLHTHPQEDAYAVSETMPISVVADGVTLLQYADGKRTYPDPSPAGEIARVFCEAALAAAEARYETFTAESMEEVFRIGNEAAAAYNHAHGRTKETVDYWDNDFYAATAAVAVAKDGWLYWGSICDSYVARLGADGSIAFMSPPCDSLKEAEGLAFPGEKQEGKPWIQYIWRYRRNGIDAHGKRTGYGVITGEPEALRYLCSGKERLLAGETVLVFTDGYEHHMQIEGFRHLFAEWSANLGTELKNLGETLMQTSLAKYGRERTITAFRA